MASRRPPVIGEPVRVIGVTAIDCAPPPITMGEPAVWVTLSTGVTAPAATVPDTTYHVHNHCAHPDLPYANPSKCFLP